MMKRQEFQFQGRYLDGLDDSWGEMERGMVEVDVDDCEMKIHVIPGTHTPFADNCCC